jgi:hypothetical protein
MPNATETFVTTQNISNYKALLEKETHPDKRRILLRLLENELAKLPEAVKRVERIRAAGFR